MEANRLIRLFGFIDSALARHDVTGVRATDQ